MDTKDYETLIYGYKFRNIELEKRVSELEKENNLLHNKISELKEGHSQDKMEGIIANLEDCLERLSKLYYA